MNYVGSINRRLSSKGVVKDSFPNVEEATKTFTEAVSTYLCNKDNAILAVDEQAMVLTYDTTEGRQEYEVQVEQVSVFELLRSSYSVLSAVCGPLAANLLSLRCACGVAVNAKTVDVLFESPTVGALPVTVRVPNTSEFRLAQLDRVLDTSYEYLKNVLTGEYYEQNV